MLLKVIGVFLLGMVAAVGVAAVAGFVFVGGVGLVAFVLKYALLFLVVYLILRGLGLVPKKNIQNGREV